jgi:hypothetical protein
LKNAVTQGRSAGAVVAGAAALMPQKNLGLGLFIGAPEGAARDDIPEE